MTLCDHCHSKDTVNRYTARICHFSVRDDLFSTDLCNNCFRRLKEKIEALHSHLSETAGMKEVIPRP